MDSILNLAGRFQGEGLNDEGQKFVAIFEVIQSHETGVAFIYTAQDLSGNSLHRESSLLGRNMLGTLSLFVLSSNHPGIFERRIVRQDNNVVVFGFGDLTNKNSYREEILMEFKGDILRYVYSWGLPGGEFAERSGCWLKSGPPI